MGLLADAFSYGNGLKRKVNGLLADPVGTLELGVNRLGEDQNKLLGLLKDVMPAGRYVAPEVRKNALKELADYGSQVGLAGATVWHGSPHKFDKFDSSKIGTGEGAQAYGHGLYLAENPSVAQEYADALGKEVLLKGKPAYQAKTGAVAADLPVSSSAAGHLRMNDWDLQKALKMAEDDFIETGDQWFSKVHKELSTLAPNDIQINRGQMYKVDLPDEHIAKMLDWDKPLSQQHPDVQAALAKAKNKQLRAVVDFASTPYSTAGLEGEVKTMGEAIKLLGMNTSPAKGSAMLAKQGIPGIRYLDSGSRGTGAGTSNFVVFPGNENLLQILERNGQPVNALQGLLAP